VHQLEIEVGGRRFGVVEVLSGLNEGDPIVVEGIIKLREGARVRFQDAEITESTSSQGSVPPGSTAGARS
jgi:membrane fusion protein (multidrug efflux system)